MTDSATNPVDYIVIGHVAKDLTPEGSLLGGTVAYAGLTAHALGVRVGVITSSAKDHDLSLLDGLDMICIPAERSTTFENRYTAKGRTQILHARASTIHPSDVPQEWRSPKVLHLGPVADEIIPSSMQDFSDGFIGITPQGWLRRWEDDGLVRLANWVEIRHVLHAANAVVLSIEDLSGDYDAAQKIAEHSEILAVTNGVMGAYVFWLGQKRYMPAPSVDEVDPTGAGDIFAAAFFLRLFQTEDPWESARFANFLAASSVMRRGLEGTPTIDEVQAAYEWVRVNP